MTFRSYFNQNLDYNAVDMRQLFDKHWTAGVLDGFDKTVNSNTQFQIEAGTGYVTHSGSSDALRYLVTSNAASVHTVGFPSGGTYRTWLVYLQVEDSYLTSGDDVSSIGVVSNDNGGSYVAPSLPERSIPLWEIRGINTDTLSTATWIDRRYRPSSAVGPLVWYKAATGNQTDIPRQPSTYPTPVTVTGVSSTSADDGPYFVAGHTYKITTYLQPFLPDSNGTYFYYKVSVAGTQVQLSATYISGTTPASTVQTVSATTFVTPASTGRATLTVAASGICSASTDMSIYSASTSPSYTSVETVGRLL